MSHVVRWVTTERGLDAADFALVAYGGAGPLHAAMVARELRIAKVIIPRAPGHFSAYGMLMADLRRDFVHTWFTPLAQAPFDEMEKIYSEMEQRGRAGVDHRPCGAARARRHARGRYALCRPGARGIRRIAGRTVRNPRPVRASSAASTRYMRRAMAIPRPARRLRSLAFAAPSSAS